jgi:hypothetical protein
MAYRWSCEITAIPAYDLFNAKVAYLTADGQWEFSGWVKHLTYEEYLVHNSVVSVNGGVTSLSHAVFEKSFGH